MATGAEQHRVRGAQRTLTAVMNAVTEVHQQTDDHPNKETQPGKWTEMDHQFDVAQYAERRNKRNERNFEGHVACILVVCHLYGNTCEIE